MHDSLTLATQHCVFDRGLEKSRNNVIDEHVECRLLGPSYHESSDLDGHESNDLVSL